MMFLFIVIVQMAPNEIFGLMKWSAWNDFPFYENI